MSLPLLPSFLPAEGKLPLLLRLPLLAALAGPGGFTLLPLEGQGLLGLGAYGGGPNGPPGLPAGVLSLGIVKGTSVTLIADGADEKEAVGALVELVNDNFGE